MSTYAWFTTKSESRSASRSRSRNWSRTPSPGRSHVQRRGAGRGRPHPVEAAGEGSSLETCTPLKSRSPSRSRSRGLFGGQFTFFWGSLEPHARRLPARRGHPRKRFLYRGGERQNLPLNRCRRGNRFFGNVSDVLSIFFLENSLKTYAYLCMV